MTACVKYPTLRLIRTKIEDLTLSDMKPGDIKEMNKNTKLLIHNHKYIYICIYKENRRSNTQNI